MKKKAIVIHSGGMDSSLCLYQAIQDHGAQNVLSLTFRYGQRHAVELKASQLICSEWGVDQTILDINCLSQITENSLVNHDLKIEFDGDEPNSLVVGRNGLMVRLAAIHAESLGADQVYTGVIEVEEANSGYRDCSRSYMDLMQEILRIDLGNDQFQIQTPVVKMTKLETMEMARDFGILEFLLENTISCYEGIAQQGCGNCPACFLRNQAILEYKQKYPHFVLSFLHKIKA